MFSVCETQLKHDEKIYIDGNILLGRNRREIHRHAPKALGGVGFLIINKLSNDYTFEILDDSCD